MVRVRKDPSLSVIIEENLEKLTSPLADDAIDLPSSDITISAPAAAPTYGIPTLTEALAQLDRFFQSMSISSLAFPHTSSTQLSIQDLVHTFGQTQEGLKYYQQKHKVRASLMTSGL